MVRWSQGGHRGESLRLAYVTVSLPNTSEVFLSVEINGLRELGAQVEVFALRRRHPNHERLVTEQGLEGVGIRFYPLFSLPVLADVLYWLVRRPVAVGLFAARLLMACRKRPDVLLRSLAIVPKSFSIARAVQREGIPLVHTAWSHYPAVTALLVKQLVPSVRLTMSLGAYDRLAHHPVTALAANRAECVLTQSRALRAVIPQEFPDMEAPIRTIMRGIDVARLRRFKSTNRVSGLVVSVGRLVPEKGHHFSIQAVARLTRKHPQLRLKIYGDGPYEEELLSLVRSLELDDVVELCSHVEQSKMFRELARAQVFVLPTLDDNLPNSVKEAMALGVPVVTSPTTGIEELIMEGETGFLVEPDDVACLARTIDSLLQDDALAGRISAAAGAHVESLAGLARSSEARFLLYSLLLQRARAHRSGRVGATGAVTED